MNRFKKGLAMLLTLVLFVGCFSMMSFAANEEVTAYFDSTRVYHDLPYGKTSKDVTVLSIKKDDKVDFNVINFPRSVNKSPFNNFALINLREFRVESGNKYVASKDGVLYTKDMKTLLCYPSGKKDVTFTIPAGVTSIANEAFYGNVYLKTVNFPAGLVTIGEFALFDCPNIKSVKIPDSVKSIKVQALGRYYVYPKVPEGSPSKFYDANVPGFTIYAKKGSNAESYAKNLALKFVATCSHAKRVSTTTKATMKKDGKIVSKCTACSDTKTTVIPKIKTISVRNAKVSYTKKSVIPGLIVKDSAGKTLKNGTDFTLSGTRSATKIGKYSFKVTFKGKYSGSKSLTWEITPAQVKNLKATPTTSQITLNWSKSTGAKQYGVYKYSSGKWTRLATTTKTTYAIKKLKAGTTYKFCVKAENGKSLSYITIINTSTRPLTPTVTSVSAKSRNVTVCYKQVPSVTGYVIYASKDKSFKNDVSKITVSGSKTLKGTLKDMPKGTVYVRVRAYRAVSGVNIFSAYSSVKSVKVK